MGFFDAREPAAAEAPEVRERAVAGFADPGVAVDEVGEWSAACGGERVGADLAVDGDAAGVLQHAGGTADAVVDAGVEVHERESRRQIVCA